MFDNSEKIKSLITKTTNFPCSLNESFAQFIIKISYSGVSVFFKKYGSIKNKVEYFVKSINDIDI